MAEEQRPLNRVALVTGAAQGIGEAIALQLAQDGLDVAINDVPDKEAQLAKVAQAIESKGRRAVVVCGDVSLEPDVASMVSRTVADLGGLDVVCKVTVPVPTPVVIPGTDTSNWSQMVANAGIAHLGSITEHSVEDWDRVLSVNARGPFLCVKHAARQMVAQGRGGRIICARHVSFSPLASESPALTSSL